MIATVSLENIKRIRPMSEATWKNCSRCKKPIPFKTRYYICSVSSCNVRNTNYVFCSMPCFDQHLPIERHKSAGAIDQKSPPSPSDQAGSQARRIIPTAKAQLSKPSNKQISQGGEILVIASRFKDFISTQSEFNTSAAVMDRLSDHLRHIAMQAIDNARSDGRKTVMEQDVRFLEKLNLNI